MTDSLLRDDQIANIAAATVTHCWTDTASMDEAKHLAEQAVRTTLNELKRLATPSSAEQTSRELTPKRRGEIAAICAHDEASEKDCEAAIAMASAEIGSREDVLEEAAAVCEKEYADPNWNGHYRNASISCAAAIRALKGAQPGLLPASDTQGAGR